MQKRIVKNDFGIDAKTGRIEQACARYGVGRSTMRNIAKEAGAEVKMRAKASRRTGYAIEKESRYYSLDHGKACSRKGKTLYNIGRRWYLQ